MGLERPKIPKLLLAVYFYQVFLTGLFCLFIFGAVIPFLKRGLLSSFFDELSGVMPYRPEEMISFYIRIYSACALFCITVTLASGILMFLRVRASRWILVAQFALSVLFLLLIFATIAIGETIRSGGSDAGFAVLVTGVFLLVLSALLVLAISSIVYLCHSINLKEYLGVVFKAVNPYYYGQNREQLSYQYGGYAVPFYPAPLPPPDAAPQSKGK